MRVTINGELREIAPNSTVGDILDKLQIEPGAVVVEVNHTILDQKTCQSHQLSDGDHLEIIRFVGGG